MRDSALEIPEEGYRANQPGSIDVIDYYRINSQQRGFTTDASQYQAVLRLQQLYDELIEFKAHRKSRINKLLSRRAPPRGLYFWGGVGRGKSFLMDAFYHCVPLVRKTRVHFHHFMRDIHRKLQTLKGETDPLSIVARDIAKKYRLLCFDEFHVSDIADAMLLSRLLEYLFQNGVVFCMTSNYPPDNLYPNGLQRANFLPAIALLKQNLDIVHVDGGVDYRLRALERIDAYHYPLTPAAEQSLRKAFEEIREGADESVALPIEGRNITARRCASGIVWFEFDAICKGARGQADYLELAKRFHTVIISGIPQMTAAMSSEARRFTWLVDVFYDHKVKLIISAEVAHDALFRQGDNSGEFARTVSRLIEMQTKAYMAEPHIS